MPVASARVPALAVLGVAIVCLHHWLPPTVTHGVLRGAYGAELLFTLCGFLATALAVRARDAAAAGGQSRGGAVRAALAHALVRTLPVYAGTLLVVLVSTRQPAGVHASLWTLTFNVRAAVHGDLTGTLAHMWAPSIAFQFLVLWVPCVVLLTPARLERLACALVVLGPLSRAALVLADAPHVVLRCAGVTSLDALAGGALVCLLAGRLGARRVATHAATRLAGLAGAALIVAGMALQYDRVQAERALWETLVVTTKAPFFFWLLAVVAHGRSVLARGLTAAPLRFLARASVAMYLAHAFAPLVVRRAGLDLPLLPHGLLAFTAVTVAAGLASRFLYEERFLPLLRRFPLDPPAPASSAADGPRAAA